MTLNIQELLVLADRLDKAGQHDEANRIDEMAQKLAATMVEDDDPGFEKRLKEEGFSDPKVYVGREDEDVKPSDVVMPSSGESMDDSQRAKLTDAGWHIFEPGELHTWLKGLDKVNPGAFAKWLEEDRAMENQEEELETEASTKLAGVEETTKEPSSKRAVFEKLAVIADKLDSLGATEEAGLIDGFIEKHADDVLDYQTEDEKAEQSKSYDSKHHHSLQIREPKTKQERVDREGREKHHNHTMQHVEAGALSTRYCPEHVGVTMGRVGELTYQCPLDGNTYNWETGWTDYDGKEHPGGSVAGQTPDSSGYAIPHRIFDSRENISNKVN